MADGIREELNAPQFPFADVREHLWHVPRSFYDGAEVFPPSTQFSTYAAMK